MPPFFQLPAAERYVLANVTTPHCSLHNLNQKPLVDADGLCMVDIEVANGRIADIRPSLNQATHAGPESSDLGGSAQSQAGRSIGVPPPPAPPSAAGDNGSGPCPIANGHLAGNAQVGCAPDGSSAVSASVGRPLQQQQQQQPAAVVVDMRRCMAWPTFVDIHTHIDKGHTCERSRNPTGNLSGADRSTASDANFWDDEDVYRRCALTNCMHAYNWMDKNKIDGDASLNTTWEAKP